MTDAGRPVRKGGGGGFEEAYLRVAGWDGRRRTCRAPSLFVSPQQCTLATCIFVCVSLPTSSSVARAFASSSRRRLARQPRSTFACVSRFVSKALHASVKDSGSGLRRRLLCNDSRLPPLHSRRPKSHVLLHPTRLRRRHQVRSRSLNPLHARSPHLPLPSSPSHDARRLKPDPSAPSHGPFQCPRCRNTSLEPFKRRQWFSFFWIPL